ncbi:MAG: CCA tRNA nucleotidyltransferase [Candidatus Limivicinus sp.]|nr:CCA tRNA nucleotidyltransferase [Candidatus Limivicinus sp.]
MENIAPPKYVRQVLRSLQARGHVAYLVGGCVRDMALGVRPHDWDICTGALPEQVMEVFPGALPTGLKHGTVTVRINSRSVEVTTFRSEENYADHRHPETVRFVGELTTDLSRRDFTINAMALSPDGLIMDPFGGLTDLEHRCIRCVGSPELRFEEDALRMFRALRFSARLDFTIEEATLAAIGKKAHLASALAAERIRDEVEKTLLTPRPETVGLMQHLGLLDVFLCARADALPELKLLTKLPRKALDRWMALCVILRRRGLISSVEDFLTALRLDSRTIRCCTDGAALLEGRKPRGAPEWKRLLRRWGVDTVSCAARCRDALDGGSSSRELKSVLKSGECFSMKHLAVSGDDLTALGLKGRELGEMLNFLLDYVIEYPENNRRELLLSLAGNTEEL